MFGIAFGSRVIILLAVALLAAALASHGTAEAQGHSAVRSLSAGWVEPGGRLEVTVSAEGYGAIGQVVETLPDGFVYQGSDMPESAVSVVGQTVAFTLFQSGSFNYVVTAPAEEGSYAFTGTVKDFSRRERPVTGASAVRVGPPPTPEPTVAPTPVPARTSTPEPTLAATPEPTATAAPPLMPTPEPTATAAPPLMPTPEPTSTPTSTPRVTPTQAPTAEPTAVPLATRPAASTMRPAATQRPTATPPPTSAPTLEPTPLAGLATGASGGSQSAPPPPAPSGSMGDLPTWAIAAIVGGVAVLFVGGLAVIYILARGRREDRWRYSRW